MGAVGRPVGQKRIRRDIFLEEFTTIIEFVVNDTKMKEHTRGNVIKSFYLLYFFGMRVGEIPFLTVSNLKDAIKTKKLTYIQPKTKQYRVVPISDMQVGILEELFSKELEEDNRNYLIRSWGKARSRYNSSSLQRLLNSVIHTALSEDENYTYSTHSFRAGFVSELNENKVTIATISKLMGHTRLETTMKYLTVSDREKQEAINKRKPAPSLSEISNKKG